MKSLSIRRRVWLLGAGLVLAAAATGWLTHPTASARSKADAPVAVETTRVGRADMPVTLQALGTVQSLATVTVRSRIDGELQQVAFQEGQTVHRGDLLARIDPRPNQAAFDQSTALVDKDQTLLANARRDLARYEVLEPQHLVSKQLLDTQRATVDQLGAQLKLDQAALSNARTQLDYTRIVSPINGRTGIRLVDMGNVIHAADPGGLVVVTQIEPITVVFSLPAEQLGPVARAKAPRAVPVRALIRGESGEPVTGVLSLIDNQVDTTTGTVRFRAQFPNTDHRLWPGLAVTAQLQLRVDQGATVVPPTAVMTGPAGPFVYVAKADHRVEARPIKTAQEANGLTVVTEGLAVGETVVTSNQYRLEPGTKIRDGDAAR